MPTSIKKNKAAADVSSDPTMRAALNSRVILVPIVAGINATAKVVAFVTDFNAKVVGIDFTPLATVSFHASNFWTVGLRDETAAADVISAGASTIKNSAADFTALTLHEYVLPTKYGAVAAGSVMTVVFTKNASAVDLPAGLVRILIEEV